ncbi:MAG: hypothetical protein PUJ10_03925 [Lachnospiraceae bacterium]|nr:hypothetical protein [Lachnospiraceae bacterium]MDY3302237.1 hypothetical protein [Lachnospiraceae bacterium]
MRVEFEFYDEEPLENIITCLNYQMDKVVFFKYKNQSQMPLNNRIMKEKSEREQRQKDNLKKYLIDKCEVKEVRFVDLNRNSLKDAVEVMREAVSEEVRAGNDIYFDLTGGEDMVLFAFGILCNEFPAPLHRYDVKTNQLMEFYDTEDGSMKSLRALEEKKREISLEDLLLLEGGRIRESKEYKHLLRNDLNGIYEIAGRNWQSWNKFQKYVDNCLYHPEALTRQDANLDPVMQNFLDQMISQGFLRKCRSNSAVLPYGLVCRDSDIADILSKGGNILEYYAGMKEGLRCKESRVSVKIDWDGDLHPNEAEDVYNEIDVLTMKDHVPCFISCKTGKMDSNAVLKALYELDTVANRYGGKYCKKILLTAQDPGLVYYERAEELGIDIVLTREYH